MALLAQVVVEKASPAFDHPFSYLVPPELGELVRPGSRVLVPFGSGRRRRQGLVLQVEEGDIPTNPPLKKIAAVPDPENSLNPEQLQLLLWLHDRVFCSYYDALRVLLPAGLGLQVNLRVSLDPQWQDPLEEGRPPEEQRILDYLHSKRRGVALPVLQQELGLLPQSRAFASLQEQGALLLTEDVRHKVGDLTQQMLRLTPAYEDGSLEPAGLTPKQRQVYRLLLDCGCASVKEAAYFCGVTTAVIKALEKKDVVELFGRPVRRDPYGQADFRLVEPPPLTEPQQRAAVQLEELLDQENGSSALLYGVTGSGKTQVFLQLIQQVLDRGRQVIVMVPEISLTPQTVALFQGRFGRRVAVMHSGLSMGERVDEYKRIRDGAADVVVGTRSAVFAPLKNIGLIVLDEEQERCYQSEQSPKYHAREVAAWRCAYHKGLLLLSSATPSVESFYRAQQGKCKLVCLPGRYHGGQLPEVNLVDMSQDYGAIFSQQLLLELKKNLDLGQQSILLVNRRGYHSIVKCPDCGEVLTCPNCSVALTYHQANGRLLCHYCGHSEELPPDCPNCHSGLLRYQGFGTQRVEEELRDYFPQARVLRMDLDSTMARGAHEKKFAAFAAGDYDIMVGTQMVAKGLNFPNVTLVGVLNADQSLFAQDFRCYEKTFSLLTQVIGRCGRGSLPGRAYVQTTEPRHYLLELAARQDYDGFFKEEIAGRKLGLYPPFCELCVVGFSALEARQAREGALRFGQLFSDLARQQYSDLPLRMLEPCEPAIEKVAGRHRSQLVIKCRRSRRFSQLLWDCLRRFDGDVKNKALRCSVDFNDLGSL